MVGSLTLLYLHHFAPSMLDGAATRILERKRKKKVCHAFCCVVDKIYAPKFFLRLCINGYGHHF